MQEFVREWFERNNLSKLKFVFKGMFKNLKQMCVLCVLEWILHGFIFWKGRTEIFLQLSFK